MKKRTPLYLVILGAFVMLFVGIMQYCYSSRVVMQRENVSHLQESYAQMARTFSLFAQRNWKLLEEWDSELPNQLYEMSQKEAWALIRKKAERWHYSELYMFNESGQYSTISGRQGIVPRQGNVFHTLYQEDQTNVLTSYLSPDGERYVVFAKRIEKPVLIEGATYTGLVVSYRNDELENMLAASLYHGHSDGYLVRSDGSVVLSLQNRTEFAAMGGNLLVFTEEALDVSSSNRDELRENLAAAKSGSLLCRYGNELYYMVYQPSGIEDWSIVGVVRASAVEANARKMQTDTISLAVLICSLALLGVAWLIRVNMETELNYQEIKQAALKQQKELSDRLFTGMGRIADRYAVCDLKEDRYEYHEHLLDQPLYPPTGSYQALVEGMGQRYVILGRAEGAKVERLLSPDYLRRVLRTEKDILKFEYCFRTENMYAIMNVVPISWAEDGQLARVMLIGQDIGQKVELEILAHTDGLTGLFNERYFSRILLDQESRKIPFVLYYLDLDFFKPINDQYGHAVGDQLLKAVAGRLQGCIRSRDYAFRIGGDEFAVIIQADLDDRQKREKRELIVRTLTKPYLINGVSFSIGASCGFAHYPTDSVKTGDIRILADQRMYEQKALNHLEAGKAGD